MKTATTAWPAQETDPQRIAILDAADRLLAGTPRRSTGNLSIVQLAAEAEVKYWVVAQKHPGLRDHFQRLAAQHRRTTDEFRANHHPLVRLQREHLNLRKRCTELETLIRSYACVINELALENDVLRAQAATSHATVRPIQG
jgi:hypothetical protein